MVILVWNRFLTESRRKIILEYLRDFPDKMPVSVRGIRSEALKIKDFDAYLKESLELFDAERKQLIADIELLRTLAAFEFPRGRKRRNWREVPGIMRIRKKADAIVSAEFEVQR